MEKQRASPRLTSRRGCNISTPPLFFRSYEEAKKRLLILRGGMFWKKLADYEYLIRTSTGNSQKSLGPRSPETEVIYHKFTAQKAESASRLKDITEALTMQQRLNRALHVGRAPQILIDILNAMAEHGLSEHFTVIGTHAIYAYESAAGVRVESADALATIDVDFLWDIQKRVCFIAQMSRLNTSMIGLLQKVDKTFKIRSDQKYTAVNSKGFEVDIIRRETTLSDPHPVQTTDNDDDFWVTQARRANVMLDGPKFTAVVVSNAGHMARMHTISPLVFVKFKRWMSNQADRDPLKAPRDASQADIVEQMVAEYFPQLIN